MLKEILLCLFQSVSSLGKGRACVAQAAPEAHTPVSPVAIPMLTGECTTGLENFPLHFLESLLWEVGTSTGTILTSLLSFQSWCFVDHKIPAGCLVAHHQLLRGCPPQQLPGDWGACVAELPAEEGDDKLVMLLSCEAQGQDDTLVLCSIQELLMEHSQAGPPCQGHWRLLLHPPVLWAGIAFADNKSLFYGSVKISLELTS